MLRKCLLFLALAACVGQAVEADTIQLKDKAAVVGKVLAEKRDQVAVDIGYTVLVSPRNKVVKISKDAPEGVVKPVALRKAPAEKDVRVESASLGEDKAGFYSVADGAGAGRSLARHGGAEGRHTMPRATQRAEARRNGRPIRPGSVCAEGNSSQRFEESLDSPRLP